VGLQVLEAWMSWADRMAVELETQLTVRVGSRVLATLPVTMTVAVVGISGKVLAEYVTLADGRRALHVACAPSVKVDFSVQSSLGHRARLHDLPRVTGLVLSRLQRAVLDKLSGDRGGVFIPLPFLHPAPGPTVPSPAASTTLVPEGGTGPAASATTAGLAFGGGGGAAPLSLGAPAGTGMAGVHTAGRHVVPATPSAPRGLVDLTRDARGLVSSEMAWRAAADLATPAPAAAAARAPSPTGGVDPAELTAMLESASRTRLGVAQGGALGESVHSIPAAGITTPILEPSLRVPPPTWPRARPTRAGAVAGERRHEHNDDEVDDDDDDDDDDDMHYGKAHAAAAASGAPVAAAAVTLSAGGLRQRQRLRGAPARRTSHGLDDSPGTGDAHPAPPPADLDSSQPIAFIATPPHGRSPERHRAVGVTVAPVSVFQ
jgi:hypothetical protein